MSNEEIPVTQPYMILEHTSDLVNIYYLDHRCVPVDFIAGIAKKIQTLASLLH